MPTHLAACQGESIPLLLASGATVDARNAMGNTPLYVAAYVMAAFPNSSKSEDAVRELLAAGASPRAPNLLSRCSAPRDHVVDFGELTIMGPNPFRQDRGETRDVAYSLHIVSSRHA